MPTFGPKDGNRTPYDLTSFWVTEKGDMYHSAKDLVAWFKAVSEPEDRSGSGGYNVRAHFKDVTNNPSGSAYMSGSMIMTDFSGTALNKTSLEFLSGAISSGRGEHELNMDTIRFNSHDLRGPFFSITGSDNPDSITTLDFGASHALSDGNAFGDRLDTGGYYFGGFSVSAWIRPPSGSYDSAASALTSGSFGIAYKHLGWSLWVKTGSIGFAMRDGQSQEGSDEQGLDRIFAHTAPILGAQSVSSSIVTTPREMTSGRGPYWHIAVTSPPGGVFPKIYVNGINVTENANEVRSTAGTTDGHNFRGLFHTGSQFRIGYARDENFNQVLARGEIGDVAVWRTELSEEEVRAIYRGSKNGVRRARSGYLTNPARFRLNEHDNASDSHIYHYPTPIRFLGEPDFKGRKKSYYDDRKSIHFRSPFAEAKIYFWKRPEDLTTITLEDNRDNPHKVHFNFMHLTGAVGEIHQEDAYTYRVQVGIQSKFSIEKVAKAFIRAVNECKKLHIRAERFYDDDDPGNVFAVKLIQQRSGESGNTAILKTGSVNIHIKSHASSAFYMGGVRRHERIFHHGFHGGGDFKVIYPIGLTSGSQYFGLQVAKPNLFASHLFESGTITEKGQRSSFADYVSGSNNTRSYGSAIVAPGAVKKGVSDHGARHGSIDINPAPDPHSPPPPLVSAQGQVDNEPFKFITEEPEGTFDVNDFTRDSITPFDEAAHPFSFDFNHNRLVDKNHSTDLSSGGKFFGSGSDPHVVGEGFDTPLRSKHVIQIGLAPTTGSTLLRYSTGSGQCTMAYYQFVDNKGLGYYQGGTDDKPETSFRGIGRQQPLVPAPHASASLAVDKPYVDRLCDNLMVGFGQGTQQRNTTITDPKTEEGRRVWDNGSWASPISTFGFPYHPKYHATASMTYPMSGVIDGPFLFEKAVYVFKARTSGSNVITWGESHNDDAITADDQAGEVGGGDFNAQAKSSFDGNGGWLYNKVDSTQPKSYPTYSNLPTFTFFILNQRKANVDPGYQNSVTHVSVMDDGAQEVKLSRPFNIPTGSQSSHNSSYPNEPGSNHSNQAGVVTQGYQISKRGPGLYVDTIRDLVTFSRLMLCPSQISGTDPMSIAAVVGTPDGRQALIKDPRDFADTVISGSDPNSSFNIAAGGSSLGGHNLNVDGEIITLAFEARVPATNKHVGGMHLPTGSWPSRPPGMTNHFDDFLQLDNPQGGSNGLGISSGRRALGGEFQGADRLYTRKYGLRGEVRSGFDPTGLNGELNVDTLTSDYKVAPYLLMPEDELVFGWQTALPMSVSGSSFMHPPPEGVTASGSYGGQEYGKPPRAVCMTPTSQSAMPSIQILPGEGRLYLFGTLIKEGREKIEPTTAPPSLSIHEGVIGGTEVYDQFDTEPAMMHSGTIYDNIIDGGMRTHDLELKHRDSPNVRRIQGRTSEGTSGPTGSFLRGVRLTDESERFYDTYLPDLTEMLVLNGDSLIDGQSVGVSAGGKMSRIEVTYTTVTEDEGSGTSSEATSTITMDVPTPHSGTDNCLVLSMPSYLRNSDADGSTIRVENEGPGDAFDTQWCMNFPFEPKYSTVERRSNPVTKDSIFPVITGSDNTKIRDGKITHVVLTGSGDFIRGLGAPVIDSTYIYHWFKPYYLQAYGTAGTGARVNSEGHSGRGYMSGALVSWVTAVGAVGTFGYMTRSNGYIIATGSSNYGGSHYRANAHSYAYLCHDADLIANMHPNAFAPGGELHPDYGGTAGANPTYDWDSVFNASGYDHTTTPTNNGIDGQATTTAAGIPTAGAMDPKTFTMSGSHGSNLTGLPGVIPDTDDNRVFSDGLFSPGSTFRSSSVDNIQFNDTMAFNLAALYFGCGNGPFNTIQFERSKLAPGKIMEQYKNASYYQRNLVTNYGLVSQPVFRGFKYGVKNVRPQYSSAVFRTTHYGHLRDMLEQRVYSRFTTEVGLQEPAVQAIFLDRNGVVVADAESTNCQNLSEFCTSSLPYFDGKSVDRGSDPPDMVESNTTAQVIISDLSDLTKI